MAKEPSEVRVRDGDDVDRHLDRLEDRYGIDSVDDVRRMHGSRWHRIARTEDAERLDLHATGQADRMATDIVALTKARDDLTAQLGEVNRLVIESDGLRGRMLDGNGPISAAMRRRFREYAGEATGVARALTEYREELMMVMTAVQQTLDSYQRTEQAAVRRLTVSEGENG